MTGPAVGEPDSRDAGITRGHYELGIEGLALLRAGVARDPAAAAARVSEIAEILRRMEEPPLSDRRGLPELDAVAGYASWARSYDGEPENDTIELEQQAVRALLDELPEGVVLDAACGTGRHAAYLAGRGRAVIGIDSSEAMLEQARRKLPGVDLRRGDLRALPLEDCSASAVVCALALSHLPDLGPAVSELGRVLRPGGRLIVSNPHPFATGILNWRAVFTSDAGDRVEIPEYPHSHGAYISAFAAAGLTVRRLIEPVLTREGARARARLGRQEGFEQALAGIPAIVIWEAERASPARSPAPGPRPR